jgi:hypothetical protein
MFGKSQCDKQNKEVTLLLYVNLHYVFFNYICNDKNISTFNISHILGLDNKWSHSWNPFIEPKGLSTIIKNTHHSWNGIKIFVYQFNHYI